jgi:phage-related protein
MAKHPLVWEGEYIIVYALSRNGNSPVSKFLGKLSKSEMIKIYAVLDRIDANRGVYAHPERFKSMVLQGKHFNEIKSRQIRIGCFWKPGFNLYMAHAFKKKSAKWPKVHLEALVRAFKQFENQGVAS